MKKIFILIIIAVSLLTSIKSFSQIATFDWNTNHGFPYQQNFGANYGITSFCKVSNNVFAFLSDVDNKVRVFDTQSQQMISEFEAGFRPSDITFYDNNFYISDGRNINFFDFNGQLTNTLKLSKEIRTVYALKVIDGHVFVMTPDQKSWLVINNGQTLNKAIEYQGWMTSLNTSYKTTRVSDFVYEIEQYKNNKLINIQSFNTNQKIGSVIFAGISENTLWLDIDFITRELPLKTERYFFGISTDGSFNLVSQIQIPDIYYISMKHDFTADSENIYFMLTKPSNAELYTINPSKSNIFDSNLYSQNYHFNDNVLPTGLLEHENNNVNGNKAAIYRSQMISIGETFETHEWLCNSNNIKNYTCGGVNVTTPTWVQVGSNISIPYMWGGFSSLTQYETGLANGVSAGDKTTDAGGAGSSCAVGVDCSGFVSRAWNQTSKYGTSTLPNISTAYSSYTELKPGDIANLAGSHVRLVHTVLQNGSFLMLEATAANNAWAVTYNTYTTTSMQGAGYIPRYYNQVLEDAVYPPIPIFPMQIAENVASPVQFDWTSITGADNYRIQVSTSSSGWTATDGFTNSTTATASIPVNATTDTVSAFLWTDGAIGTFGTPTPNTTYYWTVRVNVPGQGTSVYTNPRTFTTTTDLNLPQTDFNLNIWASTDFNVHFDDYDNYLVNYRFVNISDFNGIEWRANSTKGYFTDHFNSAIHADWTALSGTWTISSQSLLQTDESITNPNIYAPVTQDSGFVYMYNWKMKIEDNTSNNRAGIFIMCTDPTQTYRGNSYMVYFRSDDNTCQIYRGTPTAIPLETDDACTVNAGTWYDYKVIYNTVTGEIKAFQNDVLVSNWTDPDPVRNGVAVSMRTGSSNVSYDDILVYKSRTEDELFTIGSNGDFRYDNPDIYTPAGRILSVINDFGDNFSSVTSHYQNIDRSEPSAISFVNDGLISDEDTTGSNSSLSASWASSTDANSGVEGYYYAIGTSAGNDDIYTWTDGGDIISDISLNSLPLVYNTTYYYSVKAINGAGLFSSITSSDGILVLDLTSLNFTNEKQNLQALIYPNPVRQNGLLNIDFSSKPTENVQIAIFDIYGKEVYKLNSTNGQKKISIPVSSFGKGVYEVVIRNGFLIKNCKVVVIY